MPSVPPDTAPLILASASPRRRELLAALGVAFEVAPSDVDEAVTEADERRGPAHVAEILALRKARAVLDDYPDAIVIGSDTVVALDGRLLGKPADVDEARAMLDALRGRAHEVVTGVAVLGRRHVEVAHGRTLVTMRDYPEAAVEAFIASGSPFDKAGGYAIQDEAFAPVERFDGCRCNVVGLPLGVLRGLLETSAPAVECPECAPEGARQGGA